MRINQSFYSGYLFIPALMLLLSCNSDRQVHNAEKAYTAGVYSGGGASAVCILETIEALKIDRDIIISMVSPADIQNGKLDSLDVLIFPGGSGSKEYLSLGQSGIEKVREFGSKRGKGLVGICAGGYLFGTTEGYPSLKLLNAGTYRDHYDRGRGLIAFDLNKKGKKIFPELSAYDTLFLQYYDGPIFKLQKENPPEVLGNILSDIATGKDDPRGITPGKPSFMTAPFGEGQIIVTTGHPESTPGLRWIVPRMARYVIGAPLKGYNSNVVRPHINEQEILYYPEEIALENSSRWGLYNENDSIVLASLKNLHSIRSRPSIRWSTGLLRHHSPTVRLAAVNYLLDTEYTYALPELVAAAREEQDPDVQTVLKEAIKQLSALIQ